MNVQVVGVNGIPTRVISCGGFIHSKPDNIKTIILVIPGSPGIIDYYQDFIEHLYELIRGEVAVWGISHAGHDVLPASYVKPPLQGNECLYDLEGQIQHKLSFINEHISDDVNLVLVGHSVGAYICLELIKRLQERRKFSINYLLFPAMEKMVETPSGRCWWLLLSYFYWFLVFFVRMFALCIPYFIQKIFIAVYFDLKSFDDVSIDTTLDLLRRDVLDIALHMGIDELKTVKDLDFNVIKDLSKHIKIYYTNNDPWCPVDFYSNMKKNVPCIDTRLCGQDIPHAFVLGYCVEMAQILVESIKSDLFGLSPSESGDYLKESDAEIE